MRNTNKIRGSAIISKCQSGECYYSWSYVSIGCSENNRYGSIYIRPATDIGEICNQTTRTRIVGQIIIRRSACSVSFSVLSNIINKVYLVYRRIGLGGNRCCCSFWTIWPSRSSEYIIFCTWVAYKISSFQWYSKVCTSSCSYLGSKIY